MSDGLARGRKDDTIRETAYKVSTVLWALVDVQFRGYEIWTWYV